MGEKGQARALNCRVPTNLSSLRANNLPRYILRAWIIETSSHSIFIRLAIFSFGNDLSDRQDNRPAARKVRHRTLLLLWTKSHTDCHLCTQNRGRRLLRSSPAATCHCCAVYQAVQLRCGGRAPGWWCYGPVEGGSPARCLGEWRRSGDHAGDGSVQQSRVGDHRQG